MPNFIIQVTVLSGVVLLIAALTQIKSTCKLLPPGLTRGMWTGVAGLIATSILGYVLFLWMTATAAVGAGYHENGLVAGVFFAAATVVFTICTMSNHAAKSMAMIAELEQAARVDPLTNLYNRRHIMTLFEAECAKSRHHQQPLSILLLDIDRFKWINDTFGHRTGDHVLRHISGLISQTKQCRLAARFGGEEFLILLPNTSSAEATQFAEQIRAAVEASTISFEEDDFIPATISIGIAASTLNETSDQLIALADHALYEAKASGRNRICIAASRSVARRPAQPAPPLPRVQSLLNSMGVSSS